MLVLSLLNLGFTQPISQDVNTFIHDEQHLERRGKKKRQRQRRRKRAKKANKSMHGLTLGVGTLGGTLGYVYAPNKKISFSGQYSTLPAPAAEYEIGESTYTDTTNLSTLTVRGNIHPISKFKWFHISAGVAYSMSTINLELPDGTHTIGGEEDTSTDGSGTVDFADIQPYIGIGGGYTNKKGLGFFLDVGANYQGPPVVEMTYNTTASQAAVDTESASIEEHYSSYQFYPVIQLGMNYMF